MHVVDHCRAPAVVFDHVAGKERADCKKAGRWATNACLCDGACAAVNAATTVPWTKPCRLARLAPLQVSDVLARHFKCVAQSVCADCHACYTAHRAHIDDSEEEQEV